MNMLDPDNIRQPISGVPGARLEILSNLRHAVLAEAPALVAYHIAGFLAAE